MNCIRSAGGRRGVAGGSRGAPVGRRRGAGRAPVGGTATGAATAATSQELWASGGTPSPSRSGTKYSVRENLSLRQKCFFFSTYACQFFWEQGPKMVSAPNVLTRNEYVYAYAYAYTYTNTCPLHGSWRVGGRAGGRPGQGPCKVYAYVHVYVYMLLSGWNIWGRNHFGTLFPEKWTCIF